MDTVYSALLGIALFMLISSSAYGQKSSYLRRETSAAANIAAAIKTNEVRVCEGPNLDIQCFTLNTDRKEPVQFRFMIQSVELGENATLRVIPRSAGRPSYTAFLPVDGHGTKFLNVWTNLQEATDQYTVEPLPKDGEPYFYFYRQTAPDTTGIFLTEGKWKGLHTYVPYGGLTAGIISSSALVGPVITPQAPHHHIMYGRQELRGFKLETTTVVNQWEGDMFGRWVAQVGGGGGGGTFAVYTGYEYSKEEITIDKQINSITAKASLGFKFGPIGGGTEITGHTAREQTKQTADRTTRSEKKMVQFTCPVKPGYNYLHLYQYQLSGDFASHDTLDSPGNSYKNTVTFPAIFQCVYAKHAPGIRPPKCVPMLCKGEHCQECCKGIDDPECQSFSFTTTEDGALVSYATYDE